MPARKSVAWLTNTTLSKVNTEEASLCFGKNKEELLWTQGS
jgi:hypothetical protein